MLIFNFPEHGNPVRAGIYMRRLLEAFYKLPADRIAVRIAMKIDLMRQWEEALAGAPNSKIYPDD